MGPVCKVCNQCIPHSLQDFSDNWAQTAEKAAPDVEETISDLSWSIWIFFFLFLVCTWSWLYSLMLSCPVVLLGYSGCAAQIKMLRGDCTCKHCILWANGKSCHCIKFTKIDCLNLDNQLQTLAELWVFDHWKLFTATILKDKFTFSKKFLDEKKKMHLSFLLGGTTAKHCTHDQHIVGAMQGSGKLCVCSLLVPRTSI